MSGARRDAIVIGGGIGGLVAAIYLAKARRNVLLLEADEALGGRCRAATSLAGVRGSPGVHLLHALDPRVVSELGLTRRGLKFAVRDMPTVSLRQDGANLILRRDLHAAERAIAAVSPADAPAYRRHRTRIFALARAMRGLWWEDAAAVPRRNRFLAQLEATSAASLLNDLFESDALKGALAFDAVSPFEAGSALAPVWRASQEMCGLQGAMAVPLGGIPALADLLIAAALDARVEVRTRTRVTKVVLADNAAVGVELESGERIFARTVISGLSRHATLLDLVPTASAGFDETIALRRALPRMGDAAITFLLNAAPALGGRDAPQNARFIIADRLESFANADIAIREAQLPDELLIEAVLPTAIDPSLAPPGQHLLSVRVRNLPLAPKEGWPALSAKLAVRVVAALEPHAAHLRERIVGLDLRRPAETGEVCGRCLLSSYAQRIGTPIDGLFLCGGDAEPMDGISGRAGRIAAGIANRFLAREKRE
jgi:phytoene dehydrogenase-like protein